MKEQSITLDGNEYITLKDWAEREGLASSTVLIKIQRNCLDGAVKIGRQWFIPAAIKNKDNRVKTGEYKNWRRKKKAKED